MSYPEHYRENWIAGQVSPCVSFLQSLNPLGIRLDMHYNTPIHPENRIIVYPVRDSVFCL